MTVGSLVKGKGIEGIRAQLPLGTVGKALSRHLMALSYGVAGGKSRNRDLYVGCTPPFKPWEIEDTLPLTRGLLVNFATSMKLGRAIRYGSVRLIQIGWLNVPPADFC